MNGTTSRRAHFLIVLLSLSIALEAKEAEAAVSPQGTSFIIDGNGNADDSTSCGLWLAESSLIAGEWGLFTGVDLIEGEILHYSDIVIPIFDANTNEWSPWHDLAFTGDIQPDLYLQNYFQNQAWVPGIASLIQCSTDLATISMVSNTAVKYDSLGVHRSKDATTGSFSYRSLDGWEVTTDLKAGRELFTDCPSQMNKDSINTDFEFSEYLKPFIQKPVSLLRSEGICLDTLLVRRSTLPNVGLGAFAKRFVKQGGVIATSPVVAVDRSQMEINGQFEKLGRLVYTDEVVHHNLLLNYALGHPNSTVLLLPYGPGVNYINHNHGGQQANAILDWSSTKLMNRKLLETTAYDILEQSRPDLAVDYIALRDIEPGEEIFLDYGLEWQRAWEAHLRNWSVPEGSNEYQSALEFQAAHLDDDFRLDKEEEANPYPANIETACYFKLEDDDIENDDDDEEELHMFWTAENMGCLRPCALLNRYASSVRKFYDVEVFDMPNLLVPEHCKLPKGSLAVSRVPSYAIQLTDREYTMDHHLPASFRHEIGVRLNMYPDSWMMMDANPMGDFLQETLAPGQLERITWKDDGTVVSANAYLIGLSPRIREVLLEYANRLGITEAFRDLTYRGNAFQPDDDAKVVFNGLNWYIHRPESHWKSNMHWISPADGKAHEDYLKALSAAGFDEILQRVGEALGMEGLAVYHLTFIGVSHCNKGFLHYDVTETGDKVFNMIIPLLLANETGPELDLRQDGSRSDDDVGRLRYQYDVASMVGDDCYHATSAVDYRISKQMRMAATVYIADIHEGNYQQMMKEYTQVYPPKDRPDLLLAMAGAHWRRDDPSFKLPKPDENWGKAQAEQ